MLNQPLFLPYALIVFRVLLAPAVIYLAYNYPEASPLIVLACFLAIVSDFFDGYIARKKGVSNNKLRVNDSRADMVYWAATFWCVWVLHPELVKDKAIWIAVVLGLEFVPNIIYQVRFKKQSATHAYLAKLWGLTLLTAIVFLFGFNISGFPFMLTLVIGSLAQIERVLIALILPHSTSDIPSVYHAWLIKKGKPIKKYKLFH